MPKCSFCGNQLAKGTGKMVVFNSGKILYFCANKCEKNMLKLGRKPLRVKWTEAYRKEKGSDGGKVVGETAEEAPVMEAAVAEPKKEVKSADKK
ncbi:hypothetical protein HZC30_06810 [Candidatus Woesearchaeota archaeon]|nr:hypothetical protein [Candidatus Woesearchaeota archaeon]